MSVGKPGKGKAKLQMPEAGNEAEEDPDNDGDGIMKPLSNPRKEKKNAEGKEMKPVTSPDAVYFANNSMRGDTVNNIAFPLSYGSADLQGFKMIDTVCLNPLDYQGLSQVSEKTLAQNFCVKDFKYQAVIQSKGLENCDGILGLSPKDYGTHSIIPMLKRAGLIERQLISFSNAFHEASFKAERYNDTQSYMVFGGYNESQIVDGADGLFNMPLASRELNPTNYWGVEGQGFLYGNTMVYDPETEPPLLAVIDSGTTLCVIPYHIYDGLMMGIAKKLKHDKAVDFVCTREEGSEDLGPCYFNNTRCLDVTSKLEPMKFIFGGIVYEIKIDAFLKDVNNDGQMDKAPPPPQPGEKYEGGCMFELRPAKDRQGAEDEQQEHKFLMGNTFLKNFVSVYDMDQQSVKLGVSVHSQHYAKAYKYNKEEIQRLVNSAPI